MRANETNNPLIHDIEYKSDLSIDSKAFRTCIKIQGDQKHKIAVAKTYRKT